MADFDERQVLEFSSRWFSAHNESTKAASFIDKLVSNKPIRDLATNPLMLTLLCLVFQERNDFDGTRADLYKQGLDVVLYRWDARRDIERDFPRGVSRATLEPLLAEIAYSRFSAGEYFFGQASLEEQIASFFRRRHFAKEDAGIDGSQILNSIEANTGLLVARAFNVYSFSHLTFQEYLTAQQAVRKPSLLLEMGAHIGDPSWREVWVLLSTMLDADDILVEMKIAIDLLVQQASSIQRLLHNFMEAGNKVSGYRAFYCGLELAIPLEFSQGDMERLLAQHGSHFDRPSSSWNLATAGNTLRLPIGASVGPRRIEIDSLGFLEPKIDAALSMAHDAAIFAGRLGISDEWEFKLSIAVLNALMRGEMLALVACDFGCVVSDAGGVARALHEAVEVARGLDTPFYNELLACRMEFAAAELSPEWFDKHYRLWLQRLQSAAVRHRNIGQTRGFSDLDKKLLKQYYRGNQLLLECMDAAPGLTAETRESLERSMFLPIDELPSFTEARQFG